MVTKRKPPPARALPPQYPTGSAEHAATANDRYIVDISHKYDVDKPVSIQPAPYWVIHDRVTGTRDARKGMTKSAVYDEVRRLNAGLPVSSVSQGKGRKPKIITPAVEWVEVLMGIPWKRAFLQHCMDAGTKLSLEDIRELRTTNWDSEGGGMMPQWLAELGAPPLPSLPAITPTAKSQAQRKQAIARYNAECAAIEPQQKKLDEAISKQLSRILGIKRKDGSRRNEWKESRRRGVSRTD